MLQRGSDSLMFSLFPIIFYPQAFAEHLNVVLKHMFKGRIEGYFLIDIKDRVMKALGRTGLIKYYDFHWSVEQVVTGMEEGAVSGKGVPVLSVAV